MSKDAQTSSMAKPVSPWNSPRVIRNHKLRKRLDLLAKVLAVGCAFAILIPLGDLLYYFIARGLEYISIARLDHNTIGLPPGLSNALVGTGVLTLVSSAIAIPLGILGGVYMAEFSTGGKFTGGLRFAADVLAGVPSVVLGYVCYLVFVRFFDFGFSAMAAALALSIIMFPYVFRTTEIALRKVPLNIKEGAIALGSTKTTMINRLVLKFALPSIMTGVLLSIGISLSETAPIIFTAGFGNYNPTGLFHSQLGYLTGVIWQFYDLSLPTDKQLAFVSVFILILIVLCLNVVARIGLRRFSKV